jgi:hypothetical protein
MNFSLTTNIYIVKKISMGEKNMIEDAFFQIKNLEESLKKNAQGILSSTMRKEINSLVKESLMEQEEVIAAAPEDDETEEAPMLPDEESDVESADQGMEPDEPMMMGDNMTGMEPEEDETIDMRGASDSEVIRVFKAMGDNDGVVVTRDNNIITLTDDDDEYIIKLNESMGKYDKHSDELDEMFNDSELKEFEDDDDMDFGYEDDEDMDFEEDEDDFSFGYDEEEIEDEDDEDDFSFGDEEDEDDFSFGYDEEDMDFEGEENENIVYEIEMNDYSFNDEDMDFEEDEDEDESYLYEEDDDFLDLDDSEYGEDENYSYSDEEDGEENEGLYESKSMKSKIKGVGMGKGPKFKYGQVTGYKIPKQKEGTKGVGMGKAKFTYKDGENLDGEYRPIKKGKKMETKEASRTYGSGRSFGRGLPKPKAAPRHLKEEVVELRTKNDEYRKALDLFRTKLNEVAIFNSNLAYATRLFTEHSTTKQEKINILRRFDDVETLKESKSLYRVIKSELSNNSLTESVSLNESIERTVNKTVSSGSAVNLIESKTYENPQFLRMKDLMSKL